MQFVLCVYLIEKAIRSRLVDNAGSNGRSGVLARVLNTQIEIFLLENILASVSNHFKSSPQVHRCTSSQDPQVHQTTVIQLEQLCMWVFMCKKYPHVSTVGWLNTSQFSRDGVHEHVCQG